MRRRWIWAGLLLALLLATGGGLAASDVLQGDICTLEADSVIEGNLFVMCRTLILDGVVNGNLFGAAINAEINGTVAHDVYIAAGQLDMRGMLGEDLNFAGAVLRVHPEAVFEDERANVVSLSLSTNIFSGTTVTGSVVSASYQLQVFGDVRREVTFWGSALSIGGEVRGDVDASVGDAEAGTSAQIESLLIPFRFLNLDLHLIDPGLLITENARLFGTLRYTSATQGNISGQLANDPIYTPIITRPDFTQINLTDENGATWIGTYLSDALQEIITLGILGMVGLLVMPRQMLAPINHLRRRPLSSLGIGIMTFILSFAVWLVVLLLILLVVFVLLALQLGDLIIVMLMTLGALNIGGASIFYFLAIYVSRVIVCLVVGRLIIRAVIGDDGSQRALFAAMLAGVILVSLVSWLPVIGSVISGLALVFGLGAITLSITRANFREPPRAQSQSAPVTILPGRTEPSRQIPPPPVIEDQPREPGMDNLPEGFNWWGQDK